LSSTMTSISDFNFFALALVLICVHIYALILSFLMSIY
jgi:hypothetical protein